MKKILLLLTTFVMAACGSDYDDTELRGKLSDLDDKLSSLEQQIAQMQQTADKINDDIAALQAIANGISITSVTPAENGGYTIQFSNGQSYTIANGAKGDKGQTGDKGETGAKGDSVNPLFRIDAEGYWQISLDGGTTWAYPNGQKVSALGSAGEGGPAGAAGARGTTPRLSVDAEGYWIVSYDDGKSYERVKDAAGQDVKAVNGAPAAGYDSVFASAKLSEDGSTLEVVLAGSTEVIALPVGGGVLAELQLDGTAVTEKQLFAYNETKVYALKAEADYVKVIGCPDGWQVVYTEGTVSVTAPEEGSRATADSTTDVSLLVVLNNGLSCVVRMEVGIDSSAAPVARKLPNPALTAGNATETSVTVNWTLDPNASAYIYKVDGGTEQTLGKVATVTVSGLTADTACTVSVKAAGDGTYFTDSDWVSIDLRTLEAGSTPIPVEQTLTLDAQAMSTAGLGIPTGKEGMITDGNIVWNWEGIGFESYLALAASANAAGDKIPVLYFYKASVGGRATTLRNTDPLGEITKITITLIDSGSKKGNIFTMTANAGGAETTVLSSNDNTKAIEHVYTFPAGNNGFFSFENASAEDGKVVSFVIEYKK